MNKKILFHSFLFLFLVTAKVQGQQQISLTLEQSVELMYRKNRAFKIAEKEVEIARNEHQKLNSYWYPTISATGMYVHLANKIEAKEPLNQLTDPVKNFIQSILPGEEIISSLLDKIGSYSLSFPLMPQDMTTIDANLIWPVFTGGKRIYAGKIGRTMVSVAEVNRGQTGAALQSLLVATYYGVRLSQKVTEVREETYNGFKQHYENAVKLEQNGMINKAERLAAEVIMEEAKRELESARKELKVAQNALRAILNIEFAGEINPVSSLFMNDTIPPVEYFKCMVGGNNYLVNTLRLQENIAATQVKIEQTSYMPTIAFFAKQTLYQNGVPKNLLPRNVIGVGFMWNIFDGLNREKKIRQAKLTRQSLALGKEKAENDLQVAIDKLYSELQDAQDNVKALDATIQMSRELVRIRKKSFQEGMATSTEVTDAETMLSKVRIAYLMAYYQYDVALVNLLSTCGTPELFWQYSRTGKTEDFIFKN